MYNGVNTFYPHLLDAGNMKVKKETRSYCCYKVMTGRIFIVLQLIALTEQNRTELGPLSNSKTHYVT